jgi:hypothetical protein
MDSFVSRHVSSTHSQNWEKEEALQGAPTPIIKDIKLQMYLATKQSKKRCSIFSSALQK